MLVCCRAAPVASLCGFAVDGARHQLVIVLLLHRDEIVFRRRNRDLTTTGVSVERGLQL